MNKRLYRTQDKDAMLCGVCGGIAEYFKIDPTLVRLGWVILTLMGGSSILIYIACALIIPKKSDVVADEIVDNVDIK